LKIVAGREKKSEERNKVKLLFLKVKSDDIIEME
jgi:hypothetical protein